MGLDLAPVSGLKLAVSNQGDHGMINFQVEDMSCGGCVRAIRAAVAAVVHTAFSAGRSSSPCPTYRIRRQPCGHPAFAAH